MKHDLRWRSKYRNTTYALGTTKCVRLSRRILYAVLAIKAAGIQTAVKDAAAVGQQRPDGGVVAPA
jgi:hypothetical protein